MAPSAPKSPNDYIIKVFYLVCNFSTRIVASQVAEICSRVHWRSEKRKSQWEKCISQTKKERKKDRVSDQISVTTYIRTTTPQQRQARCHRREWLPSSVTPGHWHLGVSDPWSVVPRRQCFPGQSRLGMDYSPPGASDSPFASAHAIVTDFSYSHTHALWFDSLLITIRVYYYACIQ